MSDQNLAIDHYLRRFEAALRHHRVPQPQEIASDVRSHIDEALGYGKPLDSVFAALGSADALARAYAVELLIPAPGGSRARAIGRMAQIAGLLAAGSFLSLIVIVTLGGFALSFLLAGVILVIGGGLEAVGVHLAHVEIHPLHPLLAVALGPVVFAAGWGMLWVLGAYMRLAIRALRRALPAKTRLKSPA